MLCWTTPASLTCNGVMRWSAQCMADRSLQGRLKCRPWPRNVARNDLASARVSCLSPLQPIVKVRQERVYPVSVRYVRLVAEYIDCGIWLIGTVIAEGNRCKLALLQIGQCCCRREECQPHRVSGAHPPARSTRSVARQPAHSTVPHCVCDSSVPLDSRLSPSHLHWTSMQHGQPASMSAADTCMHRIDMRVASSSRAPSFKR